MLYTRINHGAEDGHYESTRLGLIEVRSWPYSRIPLNTVQCQTRQDVCKQVTRFLGEATCSEKGVITIRGRHPKATCKLGVGRSRRLWKQRTRAGQSWEIIKERIPLIIVRGSWTYIEIHKLSLSYLRLSDRPDLSLDLIAVSVWPSRSRSDDHETLESISTLRIFVSVVRNRQESHSKIDSGKRRSTHRCTNDKK